MVVTGQQVKNDEFLFLIVNCPLPDSGGRGRTKDSDYEKWEEGLGFILNVSNDCFPIKMASCVYKCFFEYLAWPASSRVKTCVGSEPSAPSRRTASN